MNIDEDTINELIRDGSCTRDEAIAAIKKSQEVDEKDTIDNCQIHRFCLCRKQLREFNDVRNQNYECRSCCKEIVSYTCESKECIFEKNTGSHYYVCSMCYESTIIPEMDTKHSFLWRKIVSLMEQIKNRTNECKDNNEQRRYMHNVHFLFYEMFLVKFKKAMDDDSEYDQIEKSFSVFYDDILEEIRRNMDTMELDVIYKENMLLPEELLQANEIRLKWSKLIHVEEESESTDICCETITKCLTRKRIAFLMALYLDYFLTQFVYNRVTLDEKRRLQYVEIIESLDAYSATDLLNDYYHIEKYHAQDEKLKNCIADEKDDIIGPQCCQSFWIHEKQSNTSKPNKTMQRFSAFVKTLDVQQKEIMEISSKIHTFINHQTHKQSKMMISSDTNDSTPQSPKYNKVISKFEPQNVSGSQMLPKQNEFEFGCMEKLAIVLNKNALPTNLCNHLMKTLIDNGYDSDAIIADLTNDDHCNYKQSQIYNLFLNSLKKKYFMKIIKKHFGMKELDDDEIAAFILGRYQIYYWRNMQPILASACEEQQKTSCYVEKPKYKSLKEECINNKIYPIKLETFYDLLQGATTKTYSYCGRSTKSFSVHPMYEIPNNLPLCISHVFTLMLYCNKTELQKNYKQYGCREKNANESMANFVSMNREIGHWYSLLYEAIMCYGDYVKRGDKFYTGIKTRRVTFDTYTPWFKCPISTTVERSVAHTFCEGIGIILILEPEPDSRDRYFNVEWLSAHADEKERLFCEAQRLRITDIKYPFGGTWITNSPYLLAFRLFSSIFAGHYYILTKSSTKVTQDTLVALIRNYNENNGIMDEQTNIHISLYIEQLFYHLMYKLRKQKIFIIRSEYLKLSKILQSVLSSSCLGSLDHQYLHEFVWKLGNDELQQLKLKDKPHVFIRKKYDYDNAYNSVSPFKLGISNDSNNKYTSVHLMDLKSRCNFVMYSFVVDELKWIKNTKIPQPLERFKENPKELFFAANLLEKVKSLTVRLSLAFVRQ